MQYPSQASISLYLGSKPAKVRSDTDSVQHLEAYAAVSLINLGKSAFVMTIQMGLPVAVNYKAL